MRLFRVPQRTKADSGRAGIDVNGETIVLLPGWSVLPIARSTICSFAASNRNEGATIKVYEGRRRRTIENTLLAAFNLDSGAESINVTMSMDLEERCVGWGVRFRAELMLFPCRLTVSATAVGTDKTVQIQIEPPWPSREAWYLRTGSDVSRSPSFCSHAEFWVLSRPKTSCSTPLPSAKQTLEVGLAPHFARASLTPLFAAAGLTFDPAFKEPYFVNFSAEEETGDSTTIGRSGGEL